MASKRHLSGPNSGVIPGPACTGEGRCPRDPDIRLSSQCEAVWAPRELELIRLRGLRLLLATRLTDGGLCGHGQQTRVVEDRAELEAFAKSLQGRLRAVGVNPCDQSLLTCFAPDGLHRREHTCVGRVERR